MQSSYGLEALRKMEDDVSSERDDISSEPDDISSTEDCVSTTPTDPPPPPTEPPTPEQEEAQARFVRRTIRRYGYFCKPLGYARKDRAQLSRTPSRREDSIDIPTSPTVSMESDKESDIPVTTHP